MLTRILRVAPRYQNGQLKLTMILGLFILFWALFDSVVTYITPILIEEQGYSETILGLIIGSSSLIGGLFDFVLSKFMKRVDFRRFFLLMLALSFLHPIVLAQAHGFGIWLLAMAIWGLYYDFYGFGLFDYVGRHSSINLHAINFGIIQTFRSLAGVIGPLIVGLLIVDGIGLKVFAYQWLFLLTSTIFLVTFIVLYNRRPLELKVRKIKTKPFYLEIKLWRRISKTLLPVLILTLFIFMQEAFFWTLAPIFGEGHHWGGLFLAAFTLPSLLLSWYVGAVTKKLGKKRTAFISLLLGSAILSSFALIQNHWWVMILIFVSACFFSFTLPAIDAAYADYISETPRVEKEIIALEDLAFNIAYIIGPIFAGILADIFDIAKAFSIIGIVGVLVAIILLKITPKSININLTKLS
jgi:MFS family permease